MNETKKAFTLVLKREAIREQAISVYRLQTPILPRRLAKAHHSHIQVENDPDGWQDNKPCRKHDPETFGRYRETGAIPGDQAKDIRDKPESGLIRKSKAGDKETRRKRQENKDRMERCVS